MSDDVRTAVLGAGIAFCLLFAGTTVVAVAEAGANSRSLLLGGISLAIIGLILFGLLGAMRNPPR